MEIRPKEAALRFTLVAFQSFAFAFAFASTSVVVFAQEFHPARTVNELARPVVETVQRVATARVVLADYDLLKQDFQNLRNLTNDQIDEWLLSKTAYVSTAQTQQNVVNTDIKVTGETAHAFRPQDYRRALVFAIDKLGLIDVKGAGSLDPAQLDHRNGLATLGEAIREFAYEKLVRLILDHSHAGFETVGSYAVLDYGFEVIHQNGSKSPAGAVLRRAHNRSVDGSVGGWSEAKALEIEKVFRKYGITSVGALRNGKYDVLNVQGNKQRAIVDFGGFLTVEKFDKPVANWDTPLHVLMTPGSSGFTAPDDALRVPFNIWGFSVSGHDDPKADNPWIWSHELADHLHDGTAQRGDAEQHVRNMLGPVRQRLYGQHCQDLLGALFRGHP